MKEWYLPDPNGISPMGPYSDTEIIEMIQKGTLKVDDFVCAPALKGERWLRIFECKEFQSSFKTRPICPTPKIFSKGIYKEEISPSSSPSPVSKPLIKHCNTWKRISGMVFLHDNHKYFKTFARKINEEELIVEFHDILPKNVRIGDEFTITLFGCEQIPSFSATSVVIALDVDGIEGTATLYFLRLNPNGRKRIQNLQGQA